MAVQSTASNTAGLRPAWKPGQSGNPGGRPKLPAEVKLRLAEIGPEAVEKLATLKDSENPAVSLRACEVILDRWLGKAVQAFEDITPEVIRERVEKLAAELQLDAPTLMAEYLRLREAS